MTTKPRKPWKRSKRTSALVYRIRTVMRDAGYDEEFAIVPLAGTLSVLVNRGDDMFNLRLDKSTLEIVSTEQLQYHYKRDNIRLVFRRSV